ncbi:MAG: LptF/LptG family permease [Blastocatellia bacterium]
MMRVLDSLVMLRLLDRYLIREIVPYLLLSLLLLTAIIFFREASRFSELLVVASRNGLPMQALGRVLAALIPGILVFTLPISLLMGVLVGMGRMSGDSEVVALIASGLPRTRLLRPVILVALTITGLMLYLTFTWLPHSVHQLTDLKANQSLVFQGLTTEIKPRIFEEGIPQKVLYIEDIDRARNQWRNVFLVSLGNDPSEMMIVTANSGALRQGERSEMPELFLERGMQHLTSKAPANDNTGDEKPGSPPKDTRTAANTAQSNNDSRDKKNASEKYTTNAFAQMTLGIETSNNNKDDEALDRDATEVEEMTWGRLINFTPAPADEREWRAEIHKRLALPAACLVFAMLGVAFGISNVRTGRSFGLFLGLAFTIGYYLLALSGQHAALSGKLPVWLGIWQANILLGALGVIVIALQRRPSADPLALLRSLPYLLPRLFKNRDEQDAGLSQPNDKPAASKQAATVKGLRRVPRFRLIQLLDKLVLSDLARFFIYILSGVAALFLIITLFQLLNAITRNHTDWMVVINYLIFLLPMIVNYITPMAALVAVMVTFGLLQKTSQVVALTASGQSVYRLALPALVASILLSGFVFFNQDYVLPFTNPVQNNYRHLIINGVVPPQTYYQRNAKWLFGLESRIFSYYADPDVANNRLKRLNIIDLRRDPFGISRRIYAKSATWDAATGEWVLANGWERRFDGERPIYYAAFDEQRVRLAEGPDYFKKDLRGANSLTLAELQRKITDLQQMGFDVLDLRIALQSKIAFPLACLVMVIVALPFSFSVGKRGALYGVALGIAIGLVYWGALSLFEQMGRYEMLPPVLAAWGPNLLFGAGGLYLFLTART